MIDAPFFPSYGRGVTLAMSTTSASVTVPVLGAKQLLVTNLATNHAYFRVTQVASTATTADCALGSTTGTHASLCVSIPNDVASVVVSAIMTTGTGNLHIIPGEGSI